MLWADGSSQFHCVKHSVLRESRQQLACQSSRSLEPSYLRLDRGIEETWEEMRLMFRCSLNIECLLTGLLASLSELPQVNGDMYRTVGVKTNLCWQQQMPNPFPNCVPFTYPEERNHSSTSFVTARTTDGNTKRGSAQPYEVGWHQPVCVPPRKTTRSLLLERYRKGRDHAKGAGLDTQYTIQSSVTLQTSKRLEWKSYHPPFSPSRNL